MRYQAPEVRKGGFAGRHADMWALGCVLMEACKGAPWDVDWSALPTLRDIDLFVEREIEGLVIAHGWVRAVLLNTLKGCVRTVSACLPARPTTYLPHPPTHRRP